MNQKGQLSFEMLLITLVIFSFVIIIAGYHFMEQDTTNAMLIAKSETLSWLAEKERFYYIEKINFNVGDNELTIKLSDTFSDIDKTELVGRVKTKVENLTNLSNITVSVS